MDMLAISAPGGSNPYLYTRLYQPDSITAVNGNRDVPVDGEICYSGSYTGLVCNNIVTAKNAQWNLGNGLGTAYGMRTDHGGGTVSAGQGDSGGPGYWLTSENGVTKRSAAAIISAGVNGTTQSSGCPGQQSVRICGPSVFAGSTWQFGNVTDWQIQSIP